ncbi:MAG: Gfo/Idh/MocA family oxidoreductase [Flavobacteriaceae bacterium]|nr:Gfo/Idh/MocA family oxidoreductase [Flavobacteriaceae bacterium]
MKIKWGILGLGKIANKFAHDLQLSEDAELLAVASRAIDKAKAFSENYNAAFYYDSYEELCKNPEIDVVYIATPHTFHFENTMLCLKHGKSVLCEKPMGINTDQVERMIQEATSRKLFLMEGIWTRFLPSTVKLIELLKEKAIGDVLFMEADFGFYAPFDAQSRLFNKKLGGGSLLDIGLYPIYLSLLVLGLPDTVKALARLTATGVDSYCAILFDYENNAKAVLQSTLEAHTPTEATIYGSKGIIKLHSRFHQSEKLSLLKEGIPEQVFELPFTGHGYVHEIEEVNRCLRTKQLESDKLPKKLSLDLIKIIDRVKEEIGLQY